ncbi:MAG TPA: hypothetical protein VGS28_03060 [Candidatus Saccharimonadales bacterium]|nr:hypothetical protein [Candidatus Saccharimonadales bacterium]
MNIEQMIATKKPKVGQVLFIAVDGHGGSGKSTLAELLSKKFDAGIIHTDDFASWENPLNWWSKVVDLVFAPIAAGDRKLSYKRTKWWKDHHPKPAVNEPVTPIMILEGVSSLRKEFRDYISLGIFIDTPEAICLQRGLARDKGMDGKTDDEIIELWDKWRKEELDYVQRDDPKSYADIIIDGTKPFEDQLEHIVS